MPMFSASCVPLYRVSGGLAVMISRVRLFALLANAAHSAANSGASGRADSACSAFLIWADRSMGFGPHAPASAVGGGVGGAGGGALGAAISSLGVSGCTALPRCVRELVSFVSWSRAEPCPALSAAGELPAAAEYARRSPH